MEQTIKAVYENGCFKPLEPLKFQIDEGQIVRLTIIKVEKEVEGFKEENNQD